MLYRNIQRIALSILIIGLINLYNIIKEGVIVNLPSKSYKDTEGYLIKLIDKSIIKIDINIIKILIFVTIIFYILFYYLENNTTKEFQFKIEYDLIIGLGLIGLLGLMLSKDLIFFFLGLELYSFSTYFLILVKDTLLLRRISIFYFIISSFSSAILLYSFNEIYNKFGTLNLEIIYELLENPLIVNNPTWIFLFILLVFIFKLGAGPFLYWLIRVYVDLDKRILFYQLLIPKLLFFILLLKFLPFSLDIQPLFYSLYILSIITILFGAIGGLFQLKDNKLLTYSSILNIGYILLIFSIILINKSTIINDDTFWIIYQYFFIYIFNLLGLFSILFLFKRSSYINAFNSFYSQPFFFLSFLLLIFSFIGIPPFSGFFSKFYLFFTLFTSNTLSTISIIIFIISTLISSFFYFKFLFSSSSDLIAHSTLSKPILNSQEPNYYSFLLSFTTLFTIVYVFYISSFYPLFILSFVFNN